VLDKLPARAEYSACSAGRRYHHPVRATCRPRPGSDGRARATESTRALAAYLAETRLRQPETYASDQGAVGNNHATWARNNLGTVDNLECPAVQGQADMVLNDLQSEDVLLFQPRWFQAEPLKCFRRVLVHRQDFNLIQGDDFEFPG
jgi:hypothetical protein